GEVFPALDLYPTGTGEVIAVASVAPLGKDELERRAAALQASHGFRFPLPQILSRRMEPRATSSPMISRRPTFTTSWAGSRAGANEVSHCREQERHSFGGTVRRYAT